MKSFVKSSLRKLPHPKIRGDTMGIDIEHTISKLEHLLPMIHKYRRGAEVEGDAPFASWLESIEMLLFDTLQILQHNRAPVRPNIKHSGGGETWWYVCGVCDVSINPNDSYCAKCGTPIKWDREMEP